MLNAILCVWNEEDIIYSTVKHALAQGCAHVYIIDNDSTDQTVAEAVKAGAKHYGSFSTDVFDEVMKTVNINKAAVELTKYSPDERNWWLYIDADEFPGFDTGKTIAETLSCLPDDVRAVGGYLHDHLPTHAPYHIRGIHPIDCMPVLSKTTSSKYILLRHDKNAPPIYAQSGAHKYNANGGAVVEWDQEIIIHHFNHRQYDVTRNRLEQLIHPDAKGKRRVDWYDAMARLDNKERSMYHGRLERLDKLYANSNHVNLKTKSLPYDYRNIVRWYNPETLDMPEDAASPLDRLIWKASHVYFLGDYLIALCKYNEAVEHTTDPYTISLLTYMMACCFFHLNDGEACAQLATILATSPFEDIRNLSSTLQ